jgi:all-trans-8'-apo-beta-carotenal 15,15'-oxygenase
VSGGAWRGERGTEIVIVPIDEPDAIVRFHVDAFHLEHVVNAYEREGSVVMDYIHYSDVRGLEQYVGSVAGGVVAGPLASEVRRLVIDPRTRRTKSETLLARAVELPRVSPRVEAAAHRYAYHAGFSREGQASRSMFDALVRHDLETGAVATYSPGEGQYPSEAVFVPRAGASVEEDGWLLTMVYDGAVHRSHLQVLDARAPGDGPVARCHFDHAIPFGFHGVWSGGDGG